MTTTKSRKAKGRRLQTELQKLLLDAAPELEADDIRPAVMGEVGTDIKLSPAARKVYPYSFECKNVEKLNIWSALEQAEKNATSGTDPVLVFRKNRTQPYVAITLDHFMRLTKTSYR